MNTRLTLTRVALLTGLVLPSAIAAPDPIIPTGSLTASPTAVQAGTFPTLTWEITYPSEVKSSQDNSGGGSESGSTSGGSTSESGGTATSGSSGSGSDSSGAVAAGYTVAPGQITLADDYYVDVQIVGTGVTTSSNGGAASTNTYPTDARMSVNGEPYFQIFYGTSTDVNPSKILYSKKLCKGDTLNFGGRYVVDNAWSSFYTTKSANQQIVSLVNGDIPPTTFSLEKSSTLASYLKPYLDSNTGKVKLGSLSVLVLMELGQTDHGQSSFDHQDQVLLVTLRAKNNNGHGNNLDGVDSSNPGGGSGGPNGGVDLSAGVDDEGKVR
jgi:hypothetical protein